MHDILEGIFNVDCVITSLTNGGYAFGSTGLLVCLFVSNITQEVMNGLRFMEGSKVVQ